MSPGQQKRPAKPAEVVNAYKTYGPGPRKPRGAWGAEESGARRTGPEGVLIREQRGGAWAEKGQYYDFANEFVSAPMSIGQQGDGSEVSFQTPCDGPTA